MARTIPNMSFAIAFFGFCISVSAGTIYVNGDSQCFGVCGTDCGRSWATACPDLQAGIDAASAGDEVWVAEGTYRPIALKSGVKVYGGFTGTEDAASANDPDVHKTIIDGGGARAVVSHDNDASTELRGFVVQNGITDSLVEGGGGLHLERSSATFVRCAFVDNSAAFAGGAVANYAGGSPKFVNCPFVANGGASDKTMPYGGGAVFNHDGNPTFVNCLFHGNKAAEGGAILTLRGVVTLTNCTLTDNEATSLKGGALFDRRGNVVARNCILWNNRAKTGQTETIFNDRSLGRTTDVSYSDVEGGWPGDGNIDSDPLFVDVSKGDYRLQVKSPCLDVGLVSALPTDAADVGLNGDTTESLPHDLDMNARIQGGTVDMGAYERHATDN